MAVSNSETRILIFVYLIVALVNPLYAINTAKFWHITDIHYDPTVETEKVSCVKVVDVIPKYGSEFCDSNTRLVLSAIEGMKEIASDVEFILWTGDTKGHHMDGSIGTPAELAHKPEFLDIMTEISELLDESFPSASIVGSLGNHDYVPDGQVPAYRNDIYRNISDTWERLGWFSGNSDGLDTFREYGYYTVTLPSGMKAVTLNTNYYFIGNKVYSNLSESDPGYQFSYLENLLKQARENNTKVLISAHLPYGVGAEGNYKYMYQPYNEKITSLIREYSDVIMGSFFGHEHSNAFRVVYNDAGDAVSAAFPTPSVTPRRWITDFFSSPFHNPGIRLLEYDTDSLKLVDFTQYYFDLNTANQGLVNVSWEPLYTFSSSYGVPDASVASVALAVEKLRTGEKRDQYVTNFWNTKYAEPCDDKCLAGLVCSMTEVSHQGVDDCVAAISSDNGDDYDGFGGGDPDTVDDGRNRAPVISTGGFRAVLMAVAVVIGDWLFL